MDPTPAQQNNHQGDAPPLLGNWNRIYTAVIAVLVALITFFYYFGRAFQ